MSDILVTTALVILEGGPLGEEKLVDEVCACWPGTRLSRDRVKRAIAVARSSGLIASATDPAVGPQLHAIQQASSISSEATNWTHETLARFRADLSGRLAAEQGQVPAPAVVDHWFDAIIGAVSHGIVEAFAAHSGNVRSLGGTRLRPTSFDREATVAAIEEQLSGAAEVELGRALALDALDPSSPFGTGIITYVATGYVLHAFIARRDLERELADAGPLAGRYLILDTPILVGLVDTPDRAAEYHRLLGAACDSRLKLRVPQHVLNEFRQLFTNAVGDGGADTIGRALAEGESVATLRQLASGILSIWLAHRDLGSEPLSFVEFEKRAAEAIDQAFTQYGINVVPFNPGRDAEVNDDASDFEAALAEVLGGPSTSAVHSSQRGERAIADDSRTMAMAAERRRESDGPTAWPAAWIVTPDSKMPQAYRRARPEDDAALTLTPARAIALMAATAPIASRAELARAAASLLTQDTFLAIASRYPPKAAVQIARAFGPGDNSVDTRVAQLSLEDELDRALQESDLDDDARAVAQLLGHRERRRQALADARLHEAREVQEQLQLEAHGLRSTVDQLQGTVDRLETGLQAETQARSELEARNRELADRLAEEARRAKAAARSAEAEGRSRSELETQLEVNREESRRGIAELENQIQREREKRARRARWTWAAVTWAVTAVTVAGAALWDPQFMHDVRWTVWPVGLLGGGLAGSAIAMPTLRRELVIALSVDVLLTAIGVFADVARNAT